jgi:hypothetical protein
MKARFIGDQSEAIDPEDLPKTFTAFGVVFPRGKFVDIPDAARVKIAGNSHFEVHGVPKDVQAEVDEAALATRTAQAEATLAEERENEAFLKANAEAIEEQNAPRRGPGRPPKGD